MAKPRQGLRASVLQATGRRRKKPTNRVARAFDDLKELVSDTGDRLFSRSGQRKAATKQRSAKKGVPRKGSAQERQATAKKLGASRIRVGQQRQAAAKKAARTRGANTS